MVFYTHRNVQEEVETNIYVVGALKRVWAKSSTLTDAEVAVLAEHGSWEK